MKGDVLHSPQLIEKRDTLVAAGMPESKATGQVKGDVLHSPQLIEKHPGSPAFFGGGGTHTPKKYRSPKMTS